MDDNFQHGEVLQYCSKFIIIMNSRQQCLMDNPVNTRLTTATVTTITIFGKLNMLALALG